MAKKVTEVKLSRGYNWCTIYIGAWRRGFCWDKFKRVNPAICKGLCPNQTRKLKRTQLKNGFKLEIAKPKASVSP